VNFEFEGAVITRTGFVCVVTNAIKFKIGYTLLPDGCKKSSLAQYVDSFLSDYNSRLYALGWKMLQTTDPLAGVQTVFSGGQKHKKFFSILLQVFKIVEFCTIYFTVTCVLEIFKYFYVGFRIYFHQQWL
jgi:hypothetical protein